jgi:two-component system chemotaxis sensor kinase CheA
MALDEQAQAELREIFQVELGEHCQALTRAFLALEKEPEAIEQHQLLGEALRAAHSLKGAARAVGIGPIEALAHALESLLAQLQRSELALSPPLFDLLYAVVDAFDADAGQLETQMDSLLHLLAEARAEQSAVSSRSDSPAPSANALFAPSEAPPDLPPPLPGIAALPAERSGLGVERSARAVAVETVRLPAARLDGLLEQLGELVIPRLELTDGLADLTGLRTEIEEWQRDWRKVRSLLREMERDGRLAEIAPLVRFLERNEASLTSLATRLGTVHARFGSSMVQLGVLTDDLQGDVKRLRMLPLRSIAGGFERVVRDLARSLGKEARLVLTGTDTELDRHLLDEMKDPLLHLIRNALDHGIEPAAERLRLGKPAVGTVSLAAYQRGGSVVIDVEDDGVGLDASNIRSAAANLHLLSETDLAALPDSEVVRLIFQPGLSTARLVSQVSGRGVGLDVVARAVERLGGAIDVRATPGHGTRFRITLPLTLATTRALLIEAGGARYALHTSAVERVLRVEQTRNVGGRLMFEHDGLAVPLARLSELLGGPAARAPLDPEAPSIVALVGAGAQRVGLIIDQVVGEQEVVVKPLGYPLLRVRYIAGATILGSGQVVPILNVGDLTRAASRSTPVAALPQPATTQQRRLRVLVADDSLTTRTLERFILEAAGYEVALAGNGVEARSLLDEHEWDVLVSDVDMPELDGVTLTAQLRQMPRFRELPIVLVTSLASPEDRERGLQAGADAYMVKSSFDQDQLLRTIQELV